MKNKHFYIAVAAILFCGAAVADAPSIDAVMHNFDTAAHDVSQKLVTGVLSPNPRNFRLPNFHTRG